MDEDDNSNVNCTWMLVHDQNQPWAVGAQAGCRPCSAVLCPGTHQGISTAQQAGQPGPLGLALPSPWATAAVPWRCFGFGHRGIFQRTATVIVLPGRRKAFLLSCSCLRKLSVHLRLPGMWDPVSLKPSLGEGLRVASSPSWEFPIKEGFECRKVALLLRNSSVLWKT